MDVTLQIRLLFLGGLMAMCGLALGAVLPLHKVHENAIKTLWMNESDPCTARSWPTGRVDQRMARALQACERAVDVGHFERNVMQPGPAGGDKAADGALILLCAAGTTMCHLAALACIDIQPSA